MTKIIGLTGGIGSGKSTLARYIAAKGIPVYIADDEAKKVLNQPETVQAILATFGDFVKNETGIDKLKLAQLVFESPEKLQQLNAIIHPKVKDHFEQWLQQHKADAIVVKEAAILFESGSYKNCDKVILIVAPEKIRIQRVVHRDATNEADVKSRIKNQWNDQQRMALSDYVVTNESLEDAKEQLDKILKELLNI